MIDTKKLSDDTARAKMDSTMITLNNNSAKMDKVGYEQNSSNQNQENSMKSVLPSFHDILWCPDVDGDVMDTTGMGGAMVSMKLLVLVTVRVSARDSNPKLQDTNPLNYDTLFKNIFSFLKSML